MRRDSSRIGRVPTITADPRRHTFAWLQPASTLLRQSWRWGQKTDRPLTETPVQDPTEQVPSISTPGFAFEPVSEPIMQSARVSTIATFSSFGDIQICLIVCLLILRPPALTRPPWLERHVIVDRWQFINSKLWPDSSLTAHFTIKWREMPRSISLCRRLLRDSNVGYLAPNTQPHTKRHFIPRPCRPPRQRV